MQKFSIFGMGMLPSTIFSRINYLRREADHSHPSLAEVNGFHSPRIRTWPTQEQFDLLAFSLISTTFAGFVL
jgi:hypothetical protein